MRRAKRAPRASVDLTGFLDILSAVMVIVLLVIAVLSLSIGIGATVDPASPERAEIPQPPAPNRPPAEPAQVAITTEDGQDVTAATAFLLCKGDRLEQFEPANGGKVRAWDLNQQPPSSVARELVSPNVYLAVAGSCFGSLDALVAAFRDSGAQLGYEPTTEEAQLPWQ